jgi:hypothetical protein
MRPKSSLRAAGLLVTLLIAGCSADQQSVVVLSARAPGDKCEFDDDTVYVSSQGESTCAPTTSARRSRSRPPHLLPGAFSWQNNMASVPLVVGGQVADPGREQLHR